MPQRFGERKRDKKKKSPPLITIIVSRKISAILLPRTRTHTRVVGLLNPSRCKRSLVKHRGNASPSRIHPRELLKICWLRFIYSSNNNNNVTRRVRVRVQLLYIHKSTHNIYILYTHTHKYIYTVVDIYIYSRGGGGCGVNVKSVSRTSVFSRASWSPVELFSTTSTY